MITSRQLSCIVLVAFAVPVPSRAQSNAPATCSAVAPLSSTIDSISNDAVGASVAVLDSGAIASLGGRAISEALAARLPGVSVMRSSGVAGTGSRIRLRGPSGILAPQQPLLFMDGMRVDGEAQSIILDAGGQAPSRIDDVPIEDVRCIYVLRGPATTAAYGTDASGGVIHILTRGVTRDSTRVRGFIQGGTTTDVGDYPANYGTGSSGAACARWRVALGQCVAAPIVSFSPLDADSPFRTASLFHGGGGATIRATRRLSLGVSGTGSLGDGALRNNDHSRFTGRVSSGFQPSSAIDVRGDVYVMDSRTDLPQVGALIYSILNSAMLGNAVDDPLRRGYRNVPLAMLEQFGTEQRLRRIGGAAQLAWKPSTWLTIGALAGREDSRVRDEQADPSIRPGTGGTEFDPNRFVARGEFRGQRTTGRVSAAATYGLSAFRLTTSASVDHLAETRRRTTRVFDRTGQQPDPSWTWRGIDEATTGVVVRQALAYRERRFVDIGVRYDALDRELIELKNPVYPFASASWDVGREVGLAATGFLSALRVRAAYGESGDSRPYLEAIDIALTSGGEAIEARELERAREIEGGVDVGLFGAIAVEATVFEKRTTNGLVQQPAPPGTGGTSSVIESSAAWRTRGMELGLRARLFERRNVSANLAVTFTSLENEVDTLGATLPIVGTAFQIAPGYPIYGMWGRPFTVTDANNDGVIVPAEVTASPDARFLGSPVPTRELGVAPSITLGRLLTLAALIDHRGGFRIDNTGGRLHCNARCAALYLPGASLEDQARAVDPNDAREAWIEDGTFTRLRELSLAWTLPRAWSRGVGARSATLTAIGRNLWTSTDYSGLDPEVSYTGQSAILQTEFFTVPLPRTLAVRFDARW